MIQIYLFAGATEAIVAAVNIFGRAVLWGEHTRIEKIDWLTPEKVVVTVHGDGQIVHPWERIELLHERAQREAKLTA